MIMPKACFVFSVQLLPFIVSGFGQETNLRKEQQMEELAESLASSEDGSSESSLLLDDLSYYAGHPISINTATEEELLRLNLLNFKQVQTIIGYREKYGQILTLNELGVTGDFTEELINKIRPYFQFSQERDSLERRRASRLSQSLLARLKETLPVSSGFISSKAKPPAYSGSPYSSYFRYRGEVGKWLEFGMTAENDAGEDFFRKSNRYGFDFLSGYLCWNGKGWIRKVLIGDFHLRFGQGVSLWSGGGVSYASDLTSLMRTGEGIRPYSSTDENQFFRGGAIQFAWKPVKLSLFYSANRKDANLEKDTVGINQITSFRTDGLHRTVSEMADEKDVSERMFGGYADCRFRNWRFGIQASFERFGYPVTKGDAPYKSKSFEGESNFNLGLDYHLILNQISLFGEAGTSKNYKPAIVNGLIWRAHPQLSLSFLYRYYSPSFYSFYSGAFSEGNGGRNEEGFYAAFEYNPVSKVKIGGQADLFSFPWMTFQTISPATGRALAIQGDVTVTRNLTIYLHARFVHKPQKNSVVTGIPEQWDEATSKWRLHSDWRLNDRIQLRSRLEYVGYRYNDKKETGWLVFQDLIFSASQKLKYWIRIAYYQTDGYNSRVYSYENDLLYYFAIPEFYGIGIRSYLNIKWQPNKLMTVYLKGGYTMRSGADSMGSGYDTTQGNHRMDVRGEICLKF